MHAARGPGERRCYLSAAFPAPRATNHMPTSTITPERTKTKGIEAGASMKGMAARAMPWAVPRTPPQKRIGQAAR